MSPVVAHGTHPDVMLTRCWRAPFRVDLARTLGVHRRGKGDPAFRAEPSGAVWRTSRTPDGPATLRVTAGATETGEGATVLACAWGPGAAWLLSQHAEVGDHLAQIYEKQGRRDDAIRWYAMAMNAERPDRTIRDRLAALVGGLDRADTLARSHADALAGERTMPLKIHGQPRTTADFFVLLDNSSDGVRVENVAFISGDEALGPLADSLRTAAFAAAFPDTAPAKILRRGTLSCESAGHASSCRFVLMRIGDAAAAQPH